MGGAVYLSFAGRTIAVVPYPLSNTKGVKGVTAPRAAYFRPVEVDLSEADDARGKRNVVGHLMGNFNFKA